MLDDDDEDDDDNSTGNTTSLNEEISQTNLAECNNYLCCLLKSMTGM